MEVEFKGIGRLPDCRLAFDGLTVLVGLNGVGKSTVMKSLFGVLSPSTDFEERKTKSICGSVAHGDESTDPDERSISSMVKDCLICEFGSLSQMRRIGFKEESSIHLDNGGMHYSLSVTECGFSWSGGLTGFKDVTYYDDPFVTEVALVYQMFDNVVMDHHTDLAYKLSKIPDKNGEIQGPIGKFDSLIKKIYSGTVVCDEGRPVYVDSQGSRIGFKNVASGMKLFCVLDLLMKSGRLGEKTLLLMDEPDVHLNAKCIATLAEILTLLVNEFGVNVVLSTHHPLLLTCLVTCSYKEKSELNCHHFVESESGICVNGASGGLTEVFFEISAPMIEAYEEFWECFDVE